ncbi:DUF1016 family protein [Candidatus Sumerlaeota bacterium]|nr:DUF1016 family protein [Candidatus Sumerlaeota bacterium]
MEDLSSYRQALANLRGVLARTDSDRELRDLIEAGPGVIARYQPLFSPDGIDAITAEDFRGFLLFRNNCHWSGLHRVGPGITADMNALRRALRELTDEEVSIARRLDRLLPGGVARLKKLGKAILTPILLISRPDLYGVWNSTSENAMLKLGVWPSFERGFSFGKRYEILNQTLLHFSQDLGVDLWTLDALWWRAGRSLDELDDSPDQSPADEIDPEPARFGLERHLQDFLLDNWDTTELGQEWDLVEEGGDIRGYGYERQTPIGRIDLLARHKREPRWLVIELKRDQSCDQTVGQVLRYMGWVKQHLAKEGEQVGGLIIAHRADNAMQYALSLVPDVCLQRYEIQFSLKGVNG